MNFIKTNFVALVAILIFLIWMIFSGNGGGCSRKQPTRDTVTKTNTVYVQQPPVYIPQYVPMQSGSQAPIVIPPSYQPSANYEALIKQYNELATKFLTMNTYKDSIILHDSVGHNVGVVNLEDGVSENQIKWRKPSYTLAFPHTTITNTITITNPPKTQFYIGGGITGNQSQLLNGINLGLAMKNKKDRLYQLNAGVLYYNNKLQPQFGLSTYFKIKLGK